jgi:hypothetical protein
LTDCVKKTAEMTPAEFAKLIADETEKRGKVIQAGHIEPE